MKGAPMRDDDKVLMPGAAPRPPARPPRDASIDKRLRRYGATGNEREYAALQDQLRALEHDIARARTRLRVASEVHAHPDHAAAPPPPRGETVVLPGGGRIVIRPVEPADAEIVQAGFEHLADVSRYRRFLTPIDHLSHRQLDDLTHVDHH